MTLSPTRGRLAKAETTGPVPPHPSRRETGWPRWTVPVALVTSWLLPVLTHALALDWVLPPLLLLGVASLLRGGGTLVDRIVLALALLLGATPPAGLLISVWPWALEPVPVAGCAFSALVFIATALRRAPAFPRLRVGRDLVTLGFSVAAGLSLFWSYLGKDATGRFMSLVPGNDTPRHFAMVDTIRGIGGYLFLDRSTAAQFVDADTGGGLVTYPQGGHFTAALLMSFIHSNGSQDTPLHELDAFVWIVTSSYLLLAVAVLWAMRRIAGKLPLLVQAIAAFLVVVYLVWNEPLTVLYYGFWAEILGLAELAILVGVLVRPLNRTREQLVVVAALLVAISFTYFFLLPIALGAGACGLWFYRTRVRRHWRFFTAVLVPAVPLASVMLYVNLTNYSGAKHVAAHGGVFPLNLRPLCALGFLMVGLILTGSIWRSPTYRGYLAALVCTLGFLAALGIDQYRRLGSLPYYFDATSSYYFLKATHVVVVMVLLGAGLAARRLMALTHGWAGTSGRRQRLRKPALAAGAVLCLMATFGPVGDPRPFGRDYLLGDLPYLAWPARAAMATARQVPIDPEAMTVVWAGPRKGTPAWAIPWATAWAGALLRNQDVNYTAELWGGFAGKATLTQLAAQAKSRHVYLRVVTDSPDVIDEVKRIQSTRPDLTVTYVKVALPA